MDNRIQRFREELPRLDRFDPSRTEIRVALMAHTLAQCASIQLHTPLVQDRVTANSRTYEAAHAAAENLRRVNIGAFGCVNPFMGVSGISSFSLSETPFSGTQSPIFVVQSSCCGAAGGHVMSTASFLSMPVSSAVLTARCLAS